MMKQPAGEPDQIAALFASFQRGQSLIPERQQLIAAAPNTRAVDALDIMDGHSFSQLPLVQANV